MSYTFDSSLGEALYRLLPEIYRTRDKNAGPSGGGSGNEDLAKYLDAHGHLLDLIQGTLEQQLKDGLPESSQDWLLPYFSELLAANIVSPDSRGKHAEIYNAVSWRQRKGTLRCAEDIAEAVGQIEVEIQEGWKRVAMTPRVGMSLIPATSPDGTGDIDMSVPSEAAGHPALPAAMVDLRLSSRAVKAELTNPSAKVSSFGGVEQAWRQMNPHGVPCFTDSFDDVSKRTVDIRTADAANGHYHHKRLLAYAPPPTGFFGLLPIELLWEERNDLRFRYLFEEREESGVLVIRNRTDRIIEFTNDVTLDVNTYRIERLNFQQILKVKSGGRLELSGVEAQRVDVPTFSNDEFVLTAIDSLFGEVSAGGPVKLDSCTVLDKAYLSSVEALDSLFMDITGSNITGVIAYSRIPENTPLSTDKSRMTIKGHPLEGGTKPLGDDPQFVSGQTTLSARAVLSPNAPRSIYEGASDHREMGYYHRGRRNRPVQILGDPSFSLPEDGGYPLEDIIFENDVTVTSGQLVLVRSAVPELTVDTPINGRGKPIPSLSARDSLFRSLRVTDGLARLECCTVMEETECKHLQGSDCVFAGPIVGVKKKDAMSQLVTFLNCVRFSSISSRFLEDIKIKAENNADKKLARALQFIDGAGELTIRTNTLETPLFDQFYYCIDDNGSQKGERRKAVYGEWGYGVLSLLTPHEICFGAEDGGEMGAYHHKYYSLRAEAVLEKMKEFLPVGILPVLLLDPRLLHVPPE